MSLFPAYGDESQVSGPISSLISGKSNSVAWHTEDEALLLASDESDSAETGVTSRVSGDVPPQAQLPAVDYYEDRRGERGFRHVSTLYPPGRPLYPAPAPPRTRHARRARPLLSAVAALPSDTDRRDEARRAVAARPDDPVAWRALVCAEEERGAGEAAVQVARDAVQRLPHDRVLAELLLDVSERHLPAADHLAHLQDRLAAAPGDRALWARLVLHTAGAGALCSEDAVRAAVCAALRHNPLSQDLYLDMVYAYSMFLRSAGLVETLVLFVQLLFAMNVSPVEEPPQPTPEQEAALLLAEEAVYRAGLPAGAVWGRIERARAAVRWAPLPRPDPTDPQRCPLPADLAEMLRPLVAPDHVFVLCVHCLRALGVPLLGDGGWELSAFHGPGAERAAHWEDADGSAALAAVWAAWRGRGAASERERRSVTECWTPPHGLVAPYRQWVGRVWDAAEQVVCGAGREALRVWRVRWLHALALVAGREVRVQLAREAARLARGAGSALVAAEATRLEADVADGVRRAGRIHRVVRAALQDRAQSTPRLLAVVRAVPAEERTPRTWYTICAVLGAPLPDDVAAAPPPLLVEKTLFVCKERMKAVEEGVEPSGEAGAWGCMLPGGGEWVRAAVYLGGAASGGGGARYREEAALAAVEVSREAGRLARDLLPLYPHNRHLAGVAARGAGRWAAAGLGVRAGCAVRAAGRGAGRGGLPALESRAHHVPLYWVCAAEGAADVHSLADLVLMRGLRLRALPDEISYNQTTAQ